MVKIGFSGHRLLFDEEKVREDIHLSLLFYKEKFGEFKVISSLAIGSDSIFLEECIKLQIKADILLPYSSNLFFKDFSESERNRADAIIRCTNSGLVSLFDGQSLNTDSKDVLYWKTGQKIVDQCDFFLAVWDGKESQGVGGTKDILHYANNQKKVTCVISALKKDNKSYNKFEENDEKTLVLKDRRFQPSWKVGLVFGYFTIIFFSIPLAFQPLLSHKQIFYLSIFEFVSLLSSTVLLLIFSRKFHKRFIISRTNAETFRTKWILIDLGLQGNDNLNEFNLFDSTRKLWIYISQQINYHKKKRVEKFHAKELFLEKLKKILKVAFFVNFGFKFLLESYLFLNHLTTNSFLLFSMSSTFLSLLIPSAYATIEGIILFEDSKSNIEISKSIIKQLKKLQFELIEVSNFSDFSKISSSVFESIGNENKKWKERYQLKEIDIKI